MTFIKTEKPGMYKHLLISDNIYDFFQEQGFFFSKEILTQYYLSMKTKPFVILTGISGTGKTKIAQIFADYICQDGNEKKSRIAFVPVRPDWMDNKGILGFYNILDEKYYSTKVLDIILEAKKNPGKPYFVILDEMNLAKVEHYFSDFLSILESRTPDNPNGEAITLHSFNDAQTEQGTDIPGNIHIPSNIFFTGTVNIDESTYMFSPKVLDRANVIEFNEVNLEGYTRASSSVTDNSLVLENGIVKDSLIDNDILPFCSRTDYMQFKKIENNQSIIQSMLELLQGYNMHFGYRVINEISRFINICKDEVQKFDFYTAMDIQIIQKILPKFHGTRAKLEEPLNSLLSFCKKNNRFPRSAKKIDQMLKQLSIQGYTSFIE